MVAGVVCQENVHFRFWIALLWWVVAPGGGVRYAE